MEVQEILTSDDRVRDQHQDDQQLEGHTSYSDSDQDGEYHDFGEDVEAVNGAGQPMFDASAESQHSEAAPLDGQDWQPQDGSDHSLKAHFDDTQRSFAQQSFAQQSFLEQGHSISESHHHKAGQHHDPVQQSDYAAQLLDHEPAHRDTYTREQRRPSAFLAFARPTWTSRPETRLSDSRRHGLHEQIPRQTNIEQANPAPMRLEFAKNDYEPTEQQPLEEAGSLTTVHGPGVAPLDHKQMTHRHSSSLGDSAAVQPLQQPSRPRVKIHQPTFSRRVPQQAILYSHRATLLPRSHRIPTHASNSKPSTNVPVPERQLVQHTEKTGTQGIVPDNPVLTTAVFHAVQIAQHQAKVESEQHEAERQALSSELQQALIHKQNLVEHIQAVQSEKQDLQAVVDKQTARLGNLEAKAGRFKIFYDGLGNDFDALKKDFNAHRTTTAQLLEESGERTAEQEVLRQQVSSCEAKSRQLRSDAIKAAQDFQANSTATTARLERVEADLMEKLRLLAEEEELRCQLQVQLDKAGSTCEAIAREIKSSGNAILDKLYEMHADMEEGDHGRHMIDMLQKVSAAVQGLNSQQAATAGDIESVKGLVESCSESLLNRPAVMHAQPNQATDFKQQLDEALKNLRVEICNQEELIAQSVTNRESILDLKQKLQASEKSAEQQAVDLKTLQSIEADLKQQNAMLQAQIESLSSEQAKVTESQFNDISAELQLKSSELEATWADIATKEENLQRLTEDKARLEDKTKSLQQQLEAAIASAPSFDAEREQLGKEYAKKLDSVQKEVFRRANEFKVAENARVENEIRRLGHERDKLAEKVQTLQTQLASAQDQAKVTESTQQDLHKLRQQLEIAGQELKLLRTQKEELSTAVEKSTHVQEQYTTLSAQYSAQQQHLQSAIGEKSTLGKRVEALTQTESQLKQQLKESFDANKQVEAASEAKLRSEEERNKKRLDGLQERLAEAQGEVQRKEEELGQYKAQNEAGWTAQEDRHKEALAKANGRASQAEARRDEAAAENERLKSELAGKTQTATEVPLSQVLGAAPSRATEPQSVQPTKPHRKIVNRQQPAQESKAAQANDDPTRHTVSPESQGYFERLDATVSQVSIIEESQTQAISAARKQQTRGEVIEDSQPLRYEPPGLLDNSSSPLSTHPHPAQAEQNSQSQDTTYGLNETIDDDQDDGMPSLSQFVLTQKKPSHQSQDPDFTIFQDHSDAGIRTPKLTTSLRDPADYDSSQGKVRQNLMPPPNTSLKRTRSSDINPRASISQGSSVTSLKQVAPSTPRPHKTSQAPAKSVVGFQALGHPQEGPARSSSPAFITNSPARSAQHSPYQSSFGSANKHKPSPNRLALQPKRKADSQVVLGFESERKKRSSRTNGVQSNVQPQPRRKAGTDVSSTRQTRAQTPGPSQAMSTRRTSTRSMRGQKRTSKNDEMNARFARELPF